MVKPIKLKISSTHFQAVKSFIFQNLYPSMLLSAVFVKKSNGGLHDRYISVCAVTCNKYCCTVCRYRNNFGAWGSHNFTLIYADYGDKKLSLLTGI